jgi:hypothetical protein
MTHEVFSNHMNRLCTQFGKTAYSTERAALIWREVQHLDGAWWGKTVDRLLGECRQPPLLPEIREFISREREKTWMGEKKQGAEDAQNFFKTKFLPEDKKVICQTIIDRLRHKVPDNIWDNFLNGLRELG